MQTGREESPDRNIPRPSNPEYISQESRQPQGKRRYYYNDDPREFRASPQPESHYEAIHQPGHVRRVSAPSEMYEDKQLYYKVYHPAYTEYVPYRPTRYFERPGERYYYEEYRGEPAFEQTGGYFVPSPRTESPEMRSREAFYQQGKTGEYPQYIIDNLGQEQVVKALKLMGGFVEFLEERSPQFLNIRH